MGGDFLNDMLKGIIPSFLRKVINSFEIIELMLIMSLNMTGSIFV